MGAIAVAYIHGDQIDEFNEHAQVVVDRMKQMILGTGLEEGGECGFGVKLMKPHWDNEVVFYYQDGGTLHQIRAHELHTDSKSREHFLTALRKLGMKLPKNPFG
jgi:hypothetical protein